MARIIDGKAIATTVTARVSREAEQATMEGKRAPGLAVVIVGDDPASHAYVGAKGRMAKQCGFHSVQHTLTADITEQELLNLIDRLNDDAMIDGILVQLPLPGHIDGNTVIQYIKPEKDVDGLHVVNAGKLATGDLGGGLLPCTPAGAMELVKSVHGSDLLGCTRWSLVDPTSSASRWRSFCWLPTRRLQWRTRRPGTCRVSAGSPLVVAVGRPEMVEAGWIKPGATVIDVGINRVPAPEAGEGGSPLVGDVAFQECVTMAGAISPVPGGVGPMTIAMLMANTLEAFKRRF